RDMRPSSFRMTSADASRCLPRSDFFPSQRQASTSAAAVSHAVADSVAPRVVAAAKAQGRTKITAAGGVAANSILRGKLTELCKKEGIELYLPPLNLCGDNGAMIACQAYYEMMAGNTSDSSQNCYANMAVSDQLAGR
ncbi:MAG: hypothetical protein IIV85_05335, partial [Clostridia bacterium]|nr:hypothetical protein [Clostridia bacterium]